MLACTLLLVLHAAPVDAPLRLTPLEARQELDRLELELDQHTLGMGGGATAVMVLGGATFTAGAVVALLNLQAMTLPVYPAARPTAAGWVPPALMISGVAVALTGFIWGLVVLRARAEEREPLLARQRELEALL